MSKYKRVPSDICSLALGILGSLIYFQITKDIITTPLERCLSMLVIVR